MLSRRSLFARIPGAAALAAGLSSTCADTSAVIARQESIENGITFAAASCAFGSVSSIEPADEVHELLVARFSDCVIVNGDVRQRDGISRCFYEIVRGKWLDIEANAVYDAIHNVGFKLKIAKRVAKECSAQALEEIIRSRCGEGFLVELNRAIAAGQKA